MVDEIIDDETRKAVLQQSCLISGQNKLIIEIFCHTDHYLNTITDHFLIDQFGRKTFSHKTETGYKFQKRTTERSAKTIDANVGQDVIDQLKNQNQASLDRAKLMSVIRNAVKDRLKSLGPLAQRNSELSKALLSLLEDIGLTPSEVQDLFEDD